MGYDVVLMNGGTFFFVFFFFTPSLFVEEVDLVYMIGNRLLDVCAKKSLKVKKVRKLRGFAEELVMIFCAFRMGRN